MNTVEITYYAMLKEQRGRASETVQTDAGDFNALYEELRATHGFRYPRERLKVARNDEFVSWDTPVRDGDRVAFIPPVAGGR